MTSIGPLKPPLVAITLAAFEPNPEWFFEQLKSIQNQVHNHFVCFVLFDSAQEAVIENPRFEYFRKDPRFQFIQNEQRLGYKLNFEKGMRLACATKAKYIAFCDQDDVWYPNKISTAVVQLEQMKHGLVFCNFRILTSPYKVSAIDGWKEERREVRRSRQWDLIVRNVANGCGMVFEADTIRPYLDIPPLIKHHDIWVLLVFEKRGQMQALFNPGFAYRQHRNNQIGSVSQRKIPDQLALFLSHPLQATVPLFQESLSVYQSLESKGLANWISKLYFASFDFGLFLFLHSLFLIFWSPRTARSYLGRALGKFLFQTKSIFSTSTPSESDLFSQ